MWFLNASMKLHFAIDADVVPVNPDTVDEWTHPPYSGYFDGTCDNHSQELLEASQITRIPIGEFIWGRGSSDDKSGLIGIMWAHKLRDLTLLEAHIPQVCRRIAP